MTPQEIEAYKAERSAIAAEAAGIIVGRIFKLIIILLGLFGLFTVVAIGYSKAEKAPTEKVEKAPTKTVKTKKHKCKCECKKPAAIVKEKITIEPQKVVDIEAKLN